VAPTPADLRVLWVGRDRLLKVAEIAEHLGVRNATVYGLCERGELPYVWVVTRCGSDRVTWKSSSLLS
jgi:excisionase family DNA binding protein